MQTLDMYPDHFYDRVEFIDSVGDLDLTQGAEVFTRDGVKHTFLSRVPNMNGDRVLYVESGADLSKINPRTYLRGSGTNALSDM